MIQFFIWHLPQYRVASRERAGEFQSRQSFSAKVQRFKKFHIYQIPNLSNQRRCVQSQIMYNKLSSCCFFVISLKYFPMRWSTGVMLLLGFNLVIALKIFISYNLISRWNVTQLLCSYQDGCWKRSIVGSIFQVLIQYLNLSGTAFYQLLTVFSIVVIWCLLLVSFGSAAFGSARALNAICSQTNGCRFPASFSVWLRLWLVFGAVLFLSPNVHFLIHHAGALDQIYYLLLFMTCLIYRLFLSDGLGWRCEQSASNASLQLIGIGVFLLVLIHESVVITLLPSVIWVFCISRGVNFRTYGLPFLHLRTKQLLQITVKTWIVVLVGFGLVAISLTFIMYSLGLPSQIGLAERLKIINFPMSPRTDYFRYAFSSTGLMSLRLLFFAGQHKPLFSGTASVAVVIIAVATGCLASIGVGKRDLRGIDWSAKNSVLFLICMLSVAFSPLLMSFFGWDFYRWTSLCLLNFMFLLSFGPIALGLLLSCRSLVYETQRLLGVPTLASPRNIAILMLVITALFPPGLFHRQFSYSIFDLTAPMLRGYRSKLEDAYRSCLYIPSVKCIADLTEYDPLQFDPWSCKLCPENGKLRKPWF